MIPDGKYVCNAPISGLAAKYHLAVGAGVIDSDYRLDSYPRAMEQTILIYWTMRRPSWNSRCECREIARQDFSLWQWSINVLDPC